MIRRPVTRTCTMLLAPLALAGCALGPDYRRPDTLPVPAQYVQTTERLAAAANLAWWDLFRDPALQGLVREALQNNRDLLIATARIEEYRAQYGFTRTDQLPSLSYSAEAARVDGPFLRPFERYTVALAASWEIDLFGRLRRSTEAARADLLATEEARRGVALAIVANVARSYFQLRDLDARLEIARRTLDGRSESTRLIRLRLDQGVASELDVRQAEIEEGAAAGSIPALERGIAQVENGINYLLGRPPGPVPRGPSLVEQELPPEIPAGLPAELLQRRPDLLQAEHQLHAQMARIGVAEALRWPTLSLTAAGGTESTELSDLGKSDTRFFNLAANIFGPLFEFGRNKRRVEVQRARADELLLAYEQNVLAALREVEDELVAVRTYRAERAVRLGQVESSTAAARLARARYDTGVSSYLEVLDVERSQFDAELRASEALANQYASLVSLYAALGGGWPLDHP
ncbi:MAG: efflux transporter outer membrane subunit [Acidobacteria bacterium]|nr:efflux transporter outer membrane subunit [Acidobacteriota bacterium]